jgi:hypothetical protein
MFTSTTPAEISHLFDCIEAVQQRFSSTLSITRVSRRGELALYIADCRDTNLLYVGVLYDLWIKAHAPLWYGVKHTWDSLVVQCFCRHNQGRYLRYEDFLVCPLGQQAGGTGPDIVSVLALLNEQLRYLQEAIGPEPPKE